tara:strand:- start:3559 stop:4044 length:486 start_codon:yes stop_codon:yes gene_type:complete
MSALVSLLHENGEDDDELYYQTCINLIVISKLQVDDLLDTRKKTFELLRPSQSWIPISVYRYWYSQNRRDNVVALQRLFFDVNKIDSGNLSQLRLTDEQQHRLKKLVSKSRKGLKKLSETYSKDVQTTARIEYLYTESEKNGWEYHYKNNNSPKESKKRHF